MRVVVLAVLRATLADRGRSLVGWSLGVCGATVLILALWPTMRDLGELEQLVESYPAELRDLFGVEAMTTPAGFVSAEYLSLLGPLLFLVFAISFGARLPAEQEQRGSLDVVLSTPITRVRLLAGESLALVAAVAVLGAVQLVSFVLGTAVFGADVPVGRMAQASLALTLLGVEFGAFALLVAAATGRRAVAAAVASVGAALGYLFYIASRFVEALEPWQALTPFQQAVGQEPLLRGTTAGALAALVLPAVVAVVVALPLFDRRDLVTA